MLFKLTVLAKFHNGNWQTANSQRARTTVFLVYFITKRRENNRSVALRLAAPPFITMPTKIPGTAMRYITSTTITSQLAIGVSSAVSRQLAYPVQRSHSRLNLQIKTSFNIDSIWTFPRFLEGLDSAIHSLTSVPWITNSRPICYNHLNFFLISMAHIKAYFTTTKPKNNKKRQQNNSPRLRRRF